ncbi:hypothetical protein YH67_15910 [Stenotrophomonas maltophilia]|nr:hypothetical protein YH67_15910 [Stenotrophomonas maltophilia]ALA91625.1 hypothetical protein YH68_15910 [Stenotrophomonas maltophilia]
MCDWEVRNYRSIHQMMVMAHARIRRVDMPVHMAPASDAVRQKSDEPSAVQILFTGSIALDASLINLRMICAGIDVHYAVLTGRG